MVTPASSRSTTRWSDGDPASAPRASASDAAIGARASFLRARVLLLDGDWASGRGSREATSAASGARDARSRAGRDAPPPSARRRRRHHRRGQTRSPFARRRRRRRARRVRRRTRVLDRSRRCERRGDRTISSSFELKPGWSWTSTRRCDRTSPERSRSVLRLSLRTPSRTPRGGLAPVREDHASAQGEPPRGRNSPPVELRPTAGVDASSARSIAADAPRRRGDRRTRGRLRRADVTRSWSSVERTPRGLFKAWSRRGAVQGRVARGEDDRRAARAAPRRGEKGVPRGCRRGRVGFHRTPPFRVRIAGWAWDGGGGDDESGDAAAEPSGGLVPVGRFPAGGRLSKANGAGDGGLATRRSWRGRTPTGRWARLLRGTVDAADADLAAARRALETLRAAMVERVSTRFSTTTISRLARFRRRDDDDVDAGVLARSRRRRPLLRRTAAMIASGYKNRSGSIDSQTEEVSVDADLAALARAVAAARERRNRGPVRRAGFAPRGRGPTRLARGALKRAYARWRCCSTRTEPRDPPPAAARFLEISPRTRRCRTTKPGRGRRRAASRGSNRDGGGRGGARWGAERPTHAPDDGSAGRRERGPPRRPEEEVGQFDKARRRRRRVRARVGGCTRRPGRARTGRGTCARRGARTRASVATRASTARGASARRGRREGRTGTCRRAVTDASPAKLRASGRGERPRVPDPGDRARSRTS